MLSESHICWVRIPRWSGSHSSWLCRSGPAARALSGCSRQPETKALCEGLKHNCVQLLLKVQLSHCSWLLTGRSEVHCTDIQGRSLSKCCYTWQTRNKCDMEKKETTGSLLICWLIKLTLFGLKWTTNTGCIRPFSTIQMDTSNLSAGRW